MELLDGKKVAEKLKEENLKKAIKLYSRYNKKPCIVVLGIVGNAASEIYMKKIEKHCKETNIDCISLIAKDEIEFISNFEKVRKNNKITAIMFQQPLPKKVNEYINKTNVYKDVEGISETNMGKLFLNYDDALIPCTAMAVFEILNYYNIDVTGKKVVMIGRSNIVGKPISMLLLNKNATVTICHSKTVNLNEETNKADILIVGVGIPNFIKSDDIKKDAIVIDVGINYFNNKIVGDVDFEDVKDKVSMITPVPGGVGLVTNMTLISNILKSFELQNK